MFANVMTGMILAGAVLAVVGATVRVFSAPLSAGERVVIWCFGTGGMFILLGSIASYFV